MEEKTKENLDAEEEKACEVPEKKEEKKPEKEKKKKSREDEIEKLKLKEECEKAKSDLAEQNDKYLRLVAEYENYKKRTQKEKDDISAFTKAAFLKEFLPVFDNLARASGAEGDQLKEGVDMIMKSFHDTLTKVGVTEFGEKGEEFDPNLHEAIFHEDVEGEPENTISEVFQKGYSIGDKIIRHAMVKVMN